MKLNQVLAIEAGSKKQEYADVSRTHHELQRSELFCGFISTYQPLAEDGVEQPEQRKVVQKDALEVLKQLQGQIGNLWDIVSTKDVGNCSAKANIVVDGRVLAENVPVTYLIYLEKQLNDLRTLVAKLPVLDPSKEWVFSESRGMYEAKYPEKRIRTKKVHTPIVKIPPGPHSEGEADIVVIDTPEGTWTQTDLSTALPATKVKEMVDRVSKIQEAVRVAREEANSITVEKKNIGTSIISYVVDGSV